MPKGKLTGIVLAGGKSLRMGQNKGLLPFHGIPMVRHLVDLLDNYCTGIIISSSEKKYGDFGLKVVPDQYQGKGPLAGIHACLVQSSADWNIIVACDTPLLSNIVIERLLQNRSSQYDAVIALHNGQTEPLIGIYHRRITRHIEEQLVNDKLKMKRFLQSIHYLTVDMTDLVTDKTNPFKNINTPNDFPAK